MSFLALSAIRGVEAPSSSALLLLFILAEYAGPDGACYPSQATLMERSRLGERAVRDNLHLLVEAGLVSVHRRVRKNGSRTSDAIKLLYYTPEQAPDDGNRLARQPAKSAGGENTAKPEPDGDCGENHNRRNPPVGNRRLTPDLPADSAAPTTFEPIREPITQDGRAREAQAEEAFEEVLAEWVTAGPANTRTKPVEARAAWLAVTLGDGAVDPADLAAAARRALASDVDFRRRGPPGLQRWLADRQFEAMLHRGAAAPTEAAPSGRFADAAVRAAVVSAQGEDFAVSYLDPAIWVPEKRAIYTRTAFAADKLAGIRRRCLVGLVEIVEQRVSG